VLQGGTSGKKSGAVYIVSVVPTAKPAPVNAPIAAVAERVQAIKHKT